MLTTLVGSAAEVAVSSSTGQRCCSDALLHLGCLHLGYLRTIDYCLSCFRQVVIITAIAMVLRIEFKVVIAVRLADLLLLS